MEMVSSDNFYAVNKLRLRDFLWKRKIIVPTFIFFVFIVLFEANLYFLWKAFFVEFVFAMVR